MKFGIGTAAFIKKYGVLKINENINDLRKIINKYSKTIDLIDTAPSYANAEKNIGKFKNINLKIVTKIDKIRSKDHLSISQEINSNFLLSLRNMKTKKIYCLMLHDEKDIQLLNNKIVKKTLVDLKKKGFIKKLGISCYDINKIPKYLKIIKFDIIQFPLNVFTINKKKIEFLKKLKKKYKLEFHVRSLFLQGIALQKKIRMKKKFSEIYKKINELKEFCRKNNISLFTFYISLIAITNIVDYIIIGMKNFKEYQELKNIKIIRLNKNLIGKHYIKNQNLVDPRKW